MSALGRKATSRHRRETKPPGASPDQPCSKSHEPSEPFVNTGLDRWQREREAWTSPPPDYVPTPSPPLPPDGRPLDADDIYTALLTPEGKPLPRRVPLAEFIVVLQEVRELST